MRTQVAILSPVTRRLRSYYHGVRIKYPNTWSQKDSERQIRKMLAIAKNLPLFSQWDREPLLQEWREKGYRETWQKGTPWHFAYTVSSKEGRTHYVIHDIEHEDFITEEDTEI